MLLFLFVSTCFSSDRTVSLRHVFQADLHSEKSYTNPLYDVEYIRCVFTSPSGRKTQRNGFWDGDTDWKVRFSPDETGQWDYMTECSDTTDTGLHGIRGSFTCTENQSDQDIYTRGSIVRKKGYYYLMHTDGTPFFYTACTAWNGALKSTPGEWEEYLQDRVNNGYNVIQFVTTQWRGCDKNSLGQVAFTGSGRIELNPDFFKHLDGKVDRINQHGLVAAPVLLWALPFGKGRELSPGYYLPDNEAVLLAKYMVARYGGHHVIWILGGDGRYVDEYEQRWKNIGRGVFDREHPGIVAQHPHGRSWIGQEYAGEDWLDIVGYQSSHSNAQRTVDWINKGPMTRDWDKLPARPIINMEPNYEEIRNVITARDVRNACYWSLLATPVAGITYGANGIWPWIRPGEKPLNHYTPGHVSSWHKSIKFPGSLQIGYLASFFRRLEWTRLRPAPDLLVSQPGETTYNHFVSVAQTENRDCIVAYLPVQCEIQLYNPAGYSYTAEWFDPVKNKYFKGTVTQKNGVMTIQSPYEQDLLLVLRK